MWFNLTCMEAKKEEIYYGNEAWWPTKLGL